MVRYLGIEATRDDYGQYLYARITIRENNVNNIIEVDDHNLINQHLHNFAIQENCTVYDLINKSWITIDKSYRIPQTYGIYGDMFRKNSVSPSDYYSQKKIASDLDYFNNKKKLKGKMIKIGTIGVAVIVSLTFGVNYMIKKNNAYNNKHVKLSYQSYKPMEYDMIKTLSDYEEFDETLQAIVNNDGEYLHGKDLTDFFNYLDNLLTTNNDIIEKYRETNKWVKGASYQVDLSNYFLYGSRDWHAVYTFQNYVNNAVESMTSPSTRSMNLDNYVNRIIKFIIDPSNGYIYHNDGQGSIAYNINNLSPTARYVILRQAKGILEMYDESFVKYNTYNKQYIMNHIENRLNGSINSMKSIGNNYTNGK